MEVRKGFFWSASVRYVVGVSLLILLGGLGECAIVFHWSTLGVPEDLVSALSEAFIVSGILALLVDPLMKRRLQDDSAWGAIFGYLNPTAPEGLRTAVREVLKPQSYTKRARWEAIFEWKVEKEVLSLELSIGFTAANLGTKKHEITEAGWVLGSINNYETEYLEFIISCPDSFGTRRFLGKGLELLVTPREDGTRSLSAGKSSSDLEVPSGSSWDEFRKAVMYRGSSGYVPLHNRSYIEHVAVSLSGSALRDLEFFVTAPSVFPYEPLRLTSEIRDGGQFYEVQLGKIAPGQILLLSWRLRNGELLDGGGGK